jgi:hypothetical protein
MNRPTINALLQGLGYYPTPNDIDEAVLWLIAQVSALRTEIDKRNAEGWESLERVVKLSKELGRLESFVERQGWANKGTY